MLLTETPYQMGDSSLFENAFRTDIDNIYFTFWLTGDLCCTIVAVELKYHGCVCFRWVEIGNRIGFPQSVTIVPASGFSPGEYTVSVYIDVRMVGETTFQILQQG